LAYIFENLNFSGALEQSWNYNILRTRQRCWMRPPGGILAVISKIFHFFKN